jgi:hypothetical protein
MQPRPQQGPPGPNQDPYRPNQPGPGQNNRAQQAPYEQRPPQQGQPQPRHEQPPAQYAQPPSQQQRVPQHGQPPYGQPQHGQPPQGGTPRRTGGRSRTPRLVGPLALLVVAVITTVSCVSWVWNEADAMTPVDLPSANGTPLKTVNPSVQPTTTPPPTGKVLGSNMVASNNDTMPILSSAWSDNAENSGLYGGASIWLTVHKNYDGNHSWGDYVAFGGLHKTIPFTNTPAGLRAATAQAASIAVVRLYDKDVKYVSRATHRAISVQGHRGHEVTIRVAVSKPKLKETYSTIAVAVIDRGDGTGMVAVGDFAGSTQQWLPIWRAKVQEITFAG